MKLYSFTGSCAFAAHVCLIWTGQPFELKMLSRQELASPQIRALSPNGKVPILEDGDLVLTQNAAILNYIAERFPEAGLLGDTPRERALTHLWLGFINSDIHPAYTPLFGATAYLEDAAVIEQTKNHAKAQVRIFYEQLNTQLDGRDWLTGTRSIADAYLLITLIWASLVGVDLSGLDNLIGFGARMQVDPAVQQVIREQGLLA